ncbi:hypothetical protein HanIR_Chr13g0654161 [Helianthus annuus]|nr:hypothetical protein HanIR_Chr13g0654161 [Helianthus annuus]
MRNGAFFLKIFARKRPITPNPPLQGAFSGVIFEKKRGRRFYLNAQISAMLLTFVAHLYFSTCSSNHFSSFCLTYAFHFFFFIKNNMGIIILHHYTTFAIMPPC